MSHLSGRVRRGSLGLLGFREEQETRLRETSVSRGRLVARSFGRARQTQEARTRRSFSSRGNNPYWVDVRKRESGYRRETGYPWGFSFLYWVCSSAVMQTVSRS